MIAVITSTSIIEKINDWPGSYLVDYNSRISQTLETIRSLQDIGVNDIYMFDNSGSKHNEYLSTCYPGVKLFVQDQYSFKNKGLSEIHLILNNLHHLPEDTPICKISGRYIVSETNGFWQNAKKLNKSKVVALKGNKGISTRMYMIASKTIWEDILIGSLNICYHRQYKITGLGSLKYFVLNKLRYNYDKITPFLAIESSFFEVIKLSKIKVEFVDKLFLKGRLALNPEVLIEE